MHFVRGYFDGDGTVTTSTTKTTLGYYVKLRLLAFSCGSDDFAYALHAIIQANTGAGGRVRHAVKTCATVDFLRKKDIRAIGDWMYKDSGHLYLPRKYEKWQEVYT